MAILSNSTSNISVQDVGIKISTPGTNALSASSTQLIFDSSWPSVPVAFSYLGTLTSTSSYTVAHNLNFPPFTKIWILDSNKNIIWAPGIASYGITSTNFYLFGLSNLNAAYYYINCYNIDLSKDVDYPSLPTVSATTFYDPNFGIKIAKSGKVTSSTDGRDYILHSRFRSPLIQAVKTQDTMNPANASTDGFGATGTIQYANPTGQATWNYGFTKTGSHQAGINGVPVGTYMYAPYYAQGVYPQTITDGVTTSVFFGRGDTGATIVVLRDPFFASTITQAVYNG